MIRIHKAQKKKNNKTKVKVREILEKNFLFAWAKVLELCDDHSDGKEFACNAGDLASIPGLGRSPGEGNGNPLQYSHLENPMDREVWQIHGATELYMTEQLNTWGKSFRIVWYNIIV